MVSTLLIQAQATPQESGLRDEKWYLPLGLLSIATYLDSYGFSDLKVLDADHDSLEKITNGILQERPDIVGVNFNVFNTRLLDYVVALAHDVGSFTVVGGQAATPIPDRLLSNYNINSVVVYDGEETMLELATRFSQGNRKLEGVQNLAYRTSEGIILPSRKDLRLPNLADLPEIDRRIKGFDFDRYLKAWNRPEIDPDRIATSMYAQKGCAKTCTFCARIDKKLRQRSPEQVYDELKNLSKEGVNYVYVVDDTFAADQQYLGELATLYAERGALPIQLWAFVDARDVDDVSIDLMKRLNVEKILVGIETGNEELRRKNGKMYSNDSLLGAMEKLGISEIKVEDSYVLGLAGETDETLRDTFRLAQQVAAACQTEGTAYNIMTPLIGSPDWNRLMHVPELRAKYAEGYRFNIQELRNDYFERFCNFDPGVLS